MNKEGKDLTLSLSSVAHVASNASERSLKIAATHKYFGRFDYVHSGLGLVKNGIITELRCATPIWELGESLLICNPWEMIDKLNPYEDFRIDRVVLAMNFDLEAQNTLGSIQSFGEEVMPHLSKNSCPLAAQ